MGNEKDTVGYCIYCKADIYAGDDYVVRQGNKYHTACYDLIESDTFGVDLDEFDETNTEF